MLDICRIIIAGTLLFGSTFHSSLTQAAAPNRTLPRASNPAEAAPCKPGWPLRTPTCTA